MTANAKTCDKVVIAVDRRDSHFVYFSVGDPSDSGSIIDFAKKRGVGSLGRVRKALRPYIGQSPEPPRATSFSTALQPIGHDFTRFVSLTGQVSPEQIELVRAAIDKLPGEPEDRGHVVLAFDNDEVVAKFTCVFGAVARQDHLTLRVVRHDVRRQDWNKVLQERSSPPPT